MSKRSESQLSRLALVILPLTLLLLAFQNCTPTKGSSSDASQIPLATVGKNSSGSGNGGTYDGKLRTFFRFVPDFRCSNESIAAESIHRDENGLLQISTAVEVGNTCSMNTRPLEPGELGTSPFQSDFVVYEDLLFASYLEKPKEIPTKLAEVLCRDDFASPSLELVGHYDSLLQTAQIQFWGTRPALQSLPDIQFPSRMYSFKSVNYKSPSFNLEINLGLKIPDSKKFEGLLSLSADGSAMPVTCILGGGIDTGIWPLKTVHEGGVGESVDTTFKLPHSKASFIYSTRVGASGPLKYFFVDDEGKVIDISAAFLSGEAVGSMLINPFRNQAVFAAQYGARYFYVVDFDLKKSTKVQLPPQFPALNLGQSWQSNSVVFTEHQLIFTRVVDEYKYVSRVAPAIRTVLGNEIAIFDSRDGSLVTKRVNSIPSGIRTIQYLKESKKLLMISFLPDNVSITIYDLLTQTPTTVTATSLGIPVYKLVLYKMIAERTWVPEGHLYALNGAFFDYPGSDSIVFFDNGAFPSSYVMYASCIVASSGGQCNSNSQLGVTMGELYKIEMKSLKARRLMDKRVQYVKSFPGTSDYILCNEPCLQNHFYFDAATEKSFSLGLHNSMSATKDQTSVKSSVLAYHRNFKFARDYTMEMAPELPPSKSHRNGIYYLKNNLKDNIEKTNLIYVNPNQLAEKIICDSDFAEALGFLEGEDYLYLFSKDRSNSLAIHKLVEDKCSLTNKIPIKENKVVDTIILAKSGIFLGLTPPPKVTMVSPGGTVYYVTYNHEVVFVPVQTGLSPILLNPDLDGSTIRKILKAVPSANGKSVYIYAEKSLDENEAQTNGRANNWECGSSQNCNSYVRSFFRFNLR